MRGDLAAVNVTRTYTLAASNIAIFTFVRGPLLPTDSDAVGIFVKIDKFGESR